MAKLDIKAFGLACGILWGAAMLSVGILNLTIGWGYAFEEMMSTMYIGYRRTLLGAFIGGAWGFVDAGIGGVVLAWLYNKLAK